MASREDVLKIIKAKGPLIPATIAKEMSMPLLLAQAHLSELSSNKLVKLSSVKIGGSPLYYIDGQQPLLQNFAERLGEKDRRTYERLKEEKVLRDNAVDPLTRVSLRAIKDFAVMLEVKHGENTEIFWRWFMSSNEEVAPVIKAILQLTQEAPSTPVPQDQVSTVPETQPELSGQQVVQEQSQSALLHDEASTIAPIPTLAPPKNTVHEEPLPALPHMPASPKSIQKTLEEPQEKIDSSDDFLKQTMKYFQKQEITVVGHSCLRKNAEFEFILSVPSAIGQVEFYCRAKNKKKCNEGDLSVTYMEGQSRKLPTLFLTTGELSKKLEATLPQRYKGMIVKCL